MFKTAITLAMILTAQAAAADNPVIQNVHANQSGGLWTFDVTISHGDDGWAISPMLGGFLIVRANRSPFAN
jgi:hypothetical protein